LPIALWIEGGAIRAEAAGQLALLGSILAACSLTGGRVGSPGLGAAANAVKTGVRGSRLALRHGPPGIRIARAASAPYSTAIYIAAVVAMTFSLWDVSCTETSSSSAAGGGFAYPPPARPQAFFRSAPACCSVRHR